MIATWSDSDSSNSHDEDQQATSIDFMANEDQVQEDEIKYESSNELDFALTFFKIIKRN